jgi:hypothetical protein
MGDSREATGGEPLQLLRFIFFDFLPRMFKTENMLNISFHAVNTLISLPLIKFKYSG